MATNYIQEGVNLVMPTVSGAESGDAFVVGNYMPCVLLTDASTTSPYNATVKTEGVFNLLVKGHDGSSPATVSIGDQLFWTDKDTELDKDQSEKFFGIALAAVTSGATANIDVLLVPKSAIPATITTSDIEDEAVTLAKTADLARGSLIVGGASDRPEALNSKTTGRILVGNGTDLQSVAMSGDATIVAGGAVTLSPAKLQVSTKSFSAAQIKTLNSANGGKGLEIVAAPATDSVIEFVSAVALYDYDGANAYTAAQNVVFNVGAITVSANIANTFLQATEDKVVIAQALSATTMATPDQLKAKALYLYHGTGDPSGSATATDQLIIKATYRVNDLS
jgi:predicted RecA/RadA family phage recombinase